MGTANVTFKGTVNGLTILLKEEDNIDCIIKQIETKVKSAGKFFKGASLHVKYKGKNLNQNEEKLIYNLLQSKSGADIRSIGKELDNDTDSENLAAISSASKIKLNDYYFKGIDQGPTKFYRGTVRSGQLISYEGNLVIIGDVNPGAEIIASGNVMVMGSVRGMIHAGADGNKEAMVVAFSLHPNQLRIADIITRQPDEKDIKMALVPEIAYIKEENIFIERYLPQR